MLRGSLLLLATIAAAEARAEEIVVNLGGDQPDADPNDGTADVDLATEGLQVTLRSAIEHANAKAGVDRITFAVAVETSTLALPSIEDALSIDGSLPSGKVLLQGRGLSLVVGECTITNLAIMSAPLDAIVSRAAGRLSLGGIELTSAGGFGLRARGDVSIAGGIISSNAAGGVLSASGTVVASGVTIEANGGPGIMALGGIDLSATPRDPVHVRSNGGGLYTDGLVGLRGRGTYQISGNFGDGIRATGGIDASSPAIEIVDNASFGVRARGDVSFAGSATVSGNGHGLFASVPDAIAFEPTFSMRTGDAVRGGGILSAAGAVAGPFITASDNGGPGILASSDIAFDVLRAERNDGNGIDTGGNIFGTQATVIANFGIGLFAIGQIQLDSVTIQGNASSGLFCESAFILGGRKSEILENGKLARASIAHFDETMAVSFEPAPIDGTGLRTQWYISAVDVEISRNRGDGATCDFFDIFDAKIIANGGVGLRAVRGGYLTRTTLCNNVGGDLIHFIGVELDSSSKACDIEARIEASDEGCSCNAARSGSPGSLLLLLALALIRRRRIALLFCIGCSAEQFFAPPPPPEKAASVVFAIESEDAVKLEARAVVGGQVPPVTIEFDRLGRSILWTLYYDRDLAAHGLSEGTVRVLPEGSPLDPPDRIHRAEFLGGALSEWSTEDHLTERMQSLAVERVPAGGPCVELGEERTFSLQSRSDGAFAVRVDGERALIATTDARVYLVTFDGITLLGKALSIPIESGALAADGDLLIAATGGRMFRGAFEPELALREIARGASRDSFRWIDGPSEGEANELFAVTSSGALEHYDGSKWTILVPPDGNDDWKRGVAWVAPNEAVAVGLDSAIVRARGGVARAEDVDSLEPFTSVEHVPGLGTFAGTLAGTLLMNRSERWELLPGSALELAATSIAAIREGVIVSGGTGQTAVWLPAYGFCERSSVNSPIVKHLAVLDGAVVFLGDARDNETDPTSVSVVRIR